MIPKPHELISDPKGMGFLVACQHAFIGYGIRRKTWEKDKYIVWNPDDQCFTWFPIYGVANLLEEDGLSEADIQAWNWEAT